MALSSANCLTQGHEDPDSDPSTHMKGQEKCLGLGDGGGESFERIPNLLASLFSQLVPYETVSQ